MKLLLKGLRQGLGRAIVFADWVFSPTPIKRSEAEQAKVNEAVASLSLYQFRACPFCIKTRRAMRRLNLPIETRDASSGRYREELLSGGGEVKVPCLRIEEKGEVRWLYESDDIIAYLSERFG